jgi:hypothetical protein
LCQLLLALLQFRTLDGELLLCGFELLALGAIGRGHIAHLLLRSGDRRQGAGDGARGIALRRASGENLVEQLLDAGQFALGHLAFVYGSGVQLLVVFALVALAQLRQLALVLLVHALEVGLQIDHNGRLLVEARLELCHLPLGVGHLCLRVTLRVATLLDQLLSLFELHLLSRVLLLQLLELRTQTIGIREFDHLLALALFAIAELLAQRIVLFAQYLVADRQAFNSLLKNTDIATARVADRALAAILLLLLLLLLQFLDALGLFFALEAVLFGTSSNLFEPLFASISIRFLSRAHSVELRSKSTNACEALLEQQQAYHINEFFVQCSVLLL